MSFIPNDVIDQVLDRSDIVQVIAGYVPLKNAGRSFKALCPFHHEKTPSFVVNPDKQIFHCFGCGVGGNVISFVMKQERMEFPEAVRFLADKAGVLIPETSEHGEQTRQLRQQLVKINELALKFFHANLFSDKSPAGAAAREYLTGRQVTPDIAKIYQLGFAPDAWDTLMAHLRQENVPLDMMEKAGLIIASNKRDGYYDRFRNRVMFPILDYRGQCVAFGARSLDPQDQAKYINSPETPIYTKGRHLYGLHWSKDAVVKNDCAVVVEGYMDFLMPHRAGIPHCVASLGTALTVEQIRLLRRYTHNVVMLFDTDPAGQAAMIRSLDLLIEEGMNARIATLAEKDDPDSFVRKHGVDKFCERLDNAVSVFDFKLKYLMARIPATIEGKARIASEMLPTIAKFGNAVMQSEYMKRLAAALGISQEALHKEMAKVSSPDGAAAPRPASATAPAAAMRPVERELLRLMLEEQEFIPLTRSEVGVEDFQNEHVRTIVSEIFTMFDQGRDINLSALMNCFQSQDILKIISGLMVSPEMPSVDKKKVHTDYIQRLKQERMKAQRLSLRSQMETAKHQGDQRRMEELISEFNQLIKG
ncbi:MAG: DNA primase [Candidatus Omnitrophota bacterium]|nr:DNA primase [Candidatus Omnitrophota bacterium]MDZ4242547.1 DNA primase [Candidatus Omnitrophota bacterium]